VVCIESNAINEMPNSYFSEYIRGKQMDNIGLL
jgi:hypothetical protein